ncbi:hypothetical protein DAEQUDRAFT_725938 [Daedalea quercina L-15889]|uniref:Pentacotripeptide-repeat region of PRORP domain-containing protein n=1 Tax=Daedalea quercina L-15889 TaxID=1314783 RepID=A0A165QUM0_9APHY|nr:hypothetical protein DAEQUDRAFT_725938 [Daedalea quercina L-15889]
MAAYVLKSTSWRSLYYMRSALEVWGASLRPTASSLAATSKQYFTLSAEQAMMTMKYPEIPTDTLIFEEAEEDYSLSIDAAREKPAVEHAHHVTVDMPALLVAQGKYEEAERVLVEMRQMQLQPRTSPVFVEAAVHVLRTKSTDLQQRYLAFKKWYSLIPDATSTRRLSYLDTRVLDILLQTPTVDLTLMQECVITNVSKGYFLLRHAAVLRDVIRLSDPDASIRFLDALSYKSSVAIERMVQNFTQVSDDKLDSRFIVRANRRLRRLFEHRQSEMLKVVYNTAIDHFCKTDRVRQGVFALRLARSRDIPVHALVLTRLIAKLERTLDTENLLLVEQLSQVQSTGGPYTSRLQPAESLSSESSARPLDYSKLHKPSHLAAALRVVHRHICSPTCPDPSVLVHLIEACMRARRDHDLLTLRKRSYANTSTAMKWTLAEMLFYLKHGDAPAVGIVFGNNFRRVGVPRQVYHYTWFLHMGLTPDRFPPPKSPLQGYAMTSLLPVKEKMWPSTHHTAVVWRACTTEIRRKHSLKKLYFELLAQVKAARGQAEGLSPPEIENEGQAAASALDPAHSGIAEPAAAEVFLVPTSPAWMYDDAHFNIFIHAFGKDDPAAAARVVSDMYRFGIQPGAETMVTLLQAFAEHGDTGKLVKLFKRMEATIPPEAAHGASSATADTSATDNLNLPPPNVAAYNVVIKYLIERQRPVGASHFAVRMLKRLKYRPGTNAQADRLLVQLVHLLSDPRRTHQPDFPADKLICGIRSAHGGSVVVRRPKAGAYIAKLKLFMKRRRPVAASFTAMRMLQRSRYRPGTSVRVDRILRRLVRVLSHPKCKPRLKGLATKLASAIRYARRVKLRVRWSTS